MSSDVDQTLIAPQSDSKSGPEQVGSGRYEIKRLLGEGANKRVYLARDTRLDREVALAEIKAAHLDAGGQARLQRETQAMGQLGDHPAIVTVHDVLEENGRVFIVSQYMAGGDLRHHLDDLGERRLPPGEATRMALQIAAALEHAHARGVIHRDIKPGNIWLSAAGDAMLGDFGLAFAVDQTRLTQEGMMVGTASYMPPEQALGQLPDSRSDLYALGATLYEMVTGKPPFVGDDAVAVISQHINTRPVSPSLLATDVSRPLEGLILALLEKDPTSRPESAARVREQLERLSDLEQGPSSGSAAVTNPLDRLSSGVFVGREAEVERGRAVFDEAFAGQPRVLLLVGEPGIGKTRISEELTTYARMRGARVYWGRCHEGEGAPPFWPWVQIVRAYAQAQPVAELRQDFGFGAPDIAGMVSEIRQVLPDLPEPPQVDPEQARFRLFDAMVGFLRSASQRTPLVLVLDDLHWADRPSLLLCEFLARELGAARILVIATYRDVELRRQHPLAETLAELTRLQLGERILLRGISEHDVARFIEQSANLVPPADLVSAIHRETEGNPFFVHEVVRLLASDGRLASGLGKQDDQGTSWSLEIPQGVRDVVGRRLNRLSERCNELLLVGSVIGREFSLPLLEGVSGKSGPEVLEGLEEALAARVIAEVQGAVPIYRFSHALMRETLHEELSTPRRIALHQKAGAVLEEIHGEEAGAHLAEIAHHYFQAVQSGELDRAIRALVRAAEWAAQRQAFEEEAQHYEKAIQVQEMASEDEERHCELLVRLARAQALTGNLDRSRKTALQAAEKARQIESPEHLARAALAYGEGFVVVEMGRVDATAVDLLEEARAALDGSDSRSARELLVRVGSKLSQELYFGGDHERIDRVIDAFEPLVEQLDDPALRSELLQARLFNISSDHIDQVPARAAQLYEQACEGNDLKLQGAGLLYRICWGLIDGDRAELDRGIELEEQLATRTRMPMIRAMPLFHRATLAILEGRWQDFRPILSEAVRTMSGGAATNARQWGGMLLYMAGRHLGMLQVTDESRTFVERFPQAPIYRAYLAAIQTAVGDLDDARENYEILVANDFGAQWRDFNRINFLALIADVTFGLGDRKRAAPLYRELLPWAGLHSVGGAGVAYAGPFALRLGLLAGLEGRLETAAEHLRAGADSTEAMGARPFEAECRLHLARVLAADGPQHAPAAARVEIGRTLELGRTLNMAPTVAAAEELERAL